MLNTTTLLADELGQRLSGVFLRSFGGGNPRIAAELDEAGRLVIERLATSDALYHSAEHTALVTLVAQDILRRDSPEAGHQPGGLAAFHHRGADARCRISASTSGWGQRRTTGHR